MRSLAFSHSLSPSHALLVLCSRSCQKRYSQFESLHDQILASHATPSHPNPDLPAGCILPPKRPKMIVSHTEPSFIEERRILLQLWCRRMNSVRDIADSDMFKRFFQSDVLEQLVPVADDTYNFPADAEITQVDIPTARTMSDHVLYKVRISAAVTFFPDTYITTHKPTQYYSMPGQLLVHSIFHLISWLRSSIALCWSVRSICRTLASAARSVNGPF